MAPRAPSFPISTAAEPSDPHFHHHTSSASTSPSTSSASNRVTRSAARQAVESPNPPTVAIAPSSSSTTPPTRVQPSRKRKASSNLDQTPAPRLEPAETPPPRRNKRAKVTAPASPVAEPLSVGRRGTGGKKPKMSTSDNAVGPLSEQAESLPETSSSTKIKSSRSKKNSTAQPIPAPLSARRSKRTSTSRATEDTNEIEAPPSRGSNEEDDDHSDNDESMNDDDDEDDEDDEELANEYDREIDDDDDPFGGPPSNLTSTLRALSGMMSGVHSRLRDILANLKQKDDPSVQLIALQELSEILLVSTEDNLSGHFSSDQFIKELVTLMQPSDFGEENPEMMLLACRCIANLMEALPASTANVVYGGAVPILCQKLLEIHYIDLAEQALSTLEKISVEFPASIVREGGLTACLTYLDFFATSTQRTAVTTAANCCRNIPEDSFPVVRDVMPILLNVLSSSDQKVVEQGCLCVSRVVESFKYRQDKLETLVSADLLKAILRLLLPGTTNLIGPNIHTQFLRVLAITARASPRLSVELFKMNVVETLYQILTGVSPPDGTEDVASKIDSVVIMQALIHRPREQIFEALNVICELLPGLPPGSNTTLDDELFDSGPPPSDHLARASPNGQPSAYQKRLDLLKDCKEELKRFAIILLPTLTDAYSSTVNLSVRQKVLNAQLKMLSNLDSTILEDALRTVPYASFLASILSQQDHPTLALSALQAAELLLKRLESIYRYQFYREGVITEISNLAKKPTKEQTSPKLKASDAKTNGDQQQKTPTKKLPEESEPALMVGVNEDGDSSDMDADDDVHDDGSESSLSSRDSSSSGRNHPISSISTNMQAFLRMQAQKFLDVHENETGGKEMREKALNILEDLRALSSNVRDSFLGDYKESGAYVFQELSKYFDGDAIDSITSSELLNSGIVRALLDVFDGADDEMNGEARAAFLEAFMGRTIHTKVKTTSSKSPTTPFSVLIHKLQDLLSRSEHFEVITVHQNAFDGNRSSAASMLAKQLRIKLVGGEDSGIPRPYRNIMVSIHAIATFNALNDYLRPRISLSDRPRGARHREGISNALAAFAAAAGIPNHQQRFAERGLPPGPNPPSMPSSSEKNPRSSKRASSKLKAPNTTPAGQSSSGTHQEKPSASRRSSRKHSVLAETVTPTAPPPPPPPPPPPMQESDNVSNPLECADEKQISDIDDELDENGALSAIMDELDDEMDESSLTDPSAVHLEIAPTGKVTARQEDGTKVATPSSSQAPTSSKSKSAVSLPASMASASTAAPSPTGRPMSYAAAAQATPQDWHIEFSIAGKPISSETTIYRAVHQSHENAEDTSRGIWSAIHSIDFKRVSGPPPPEQSSLNHSVEAVVKIAPSGLPLSLDRNPTTSVILRLLNILHALNANLDDVLSENKDAIKLNAEPLAQFVNTKLTAKLNRQLEEPLIVASNCLPSWSEDLARLYPFLFPFETRHLFLQSTSFGYSRSMTRWQNAQTASQSRQDRHRDERPFLGRLQRQKLRISRAKMLESAVKVMEIYGASPSVLEVEYFEEVGTGLGPTLEFYSTVSKEFSKKKLKLWRENESPEDSEYAFGKRGLFPAPMNPEMASTENGKKVIHLFKMLGKFVARSMLDSRIIDVSFNPTFFRIGDSPTPVAPSLGAVKTVDNDLAKSLKLVKQFANLKKKIDENGEFNAAQKVAQASDIRVAGAHIDDLGLDFTLPGYPSIDLIPNGSNVSVTIDNVGTYIDRVIDLSLGSGVQLQVDAFRAGFSQVFPYSALSAFTPNELVMLFGRVEEDWSLETLLDSIKADHGFNMDSKTVRNLLQTMSELSAPERRDFLQFVTGSPKLPIGGFKSLTPMFTVVCKPSEPPYTSDDYLPSVMTCVNYLKLPDYTDRKVMRERLTLAMREGQGAFHLS